MNEIHLPKTKVAELHAICAERNNDPGELINILHAAQGLFGYLPPEVQQVIAAELNIPVSRVYGVVTSVSYTHLDVYKRQLLLTGFLISNIYCPPM